MTFHAALPHWFLVIVVIIVAVFIFKKLIKVALIIAAIGLIIWLVWSQGWIP